MIDLNAIRSLTDFKRRTAEYMKEIQETKRPLVLTVNGKAELVVQDAAAYQEMLERVERAEAVAAIRAGLLDVEQGKTRPAREALEELRQKHGISR